MDAKEFLLGELERIWAAVTAENFGGGAESGRQMGTLAAQLEHIGLLPPDTELISYADISLGARICRDLIGLASAAWGGPPPFHPGPIVGWSESLPDSALYQYLRACFEFEAGQPAAALSFVERALAINNVCTGSQKLLERIARAHPDLPGLPAGLAHAAEYLRDRTCPVPFAYLATGWGGDTFLCTCPAWLPYQSGNIHQASSAEDVWNSPAAQKIRASILDGSFKYCSRTLCSFIAGRTLPKADAPLTGFYQDLALKPFMDTGPKSVEFSHDPSCNLACPSCRTELRMAKAAETDRLATATRKVLLPLLAQTKGGVYISGGGEPFASRHFRDLLRRLNRREFPGLSLRLMTNAQLVGEEMWNEFEHLHTLFELVSVSVDAASRQVYETLRPPGKWDRLVAGIEFLAGLRSDGRIPCLRLNFVVQRANLHEVHEFVDMARRWGVDYVWLQKMANYGSFSADDFIANDVTQPGHPDHRLFQEIFSDPSLIDPFVDAALFNGTVPGIFFPDCHRTQATPAGALRVS